MNAHRLGPAQSEIIRISAPIKSRWATVKGLDLKELLSDGPYKEQYRKEMIEWSDAVRRDTPAFFCKEAYALGIDKYDYFITSDLLLTISSFLSFEAYSDS